VGKVSGMVKTKFYGGITRLTGGQKEVIISASSVRELLVKLAEIYGSPFKERVLDPSGKLRIFVNIFVNNKDIRFLKDLDTPLSDQDIVMVMPPIGGGQH